jgi:hypothetical protein
MIHSELPKFDHNGTSSTVMQSAQGNMPAWKMLEQGGNFFTYAEYDRFTQKYIPEPRFVDPKKMRGDTLRAILEQNLLKMNELIVALNALQESVLSNLEQFVETKSGKQNKG